ncbi:uncharacterized protein PRCAT00001365001 [Priceomyces carsonii]|uniref:uncharacterized protein n=1 Tax=Priceomyces carsonii TaxID=28549 RepID=UPI002ED8C6DA|nr:unnamed protein product [Priceomyces carsonii]
MVVEKANINIRKDGVPIERDAGALRSPADLTSPNTMNFDSNRSLAGPKTHKTHHTIAIKPKPVPVAVLPKPACPNLAGSLTLGSSPTSLRNSISLKINTSKKWVLPPRPRPGRKPTNVTHEDNSAKNQSSTEISTLGFENSDKTCPKKKVKVLNASCKSPPSNGANRQIVNQSIQQLYNSGKQKIVPDTSINGTETIASISERTTISQVGTFKEKVQTEDDSELIELKKTYLSKLKEQELIKNYIDVIGNQIKELNFVQNGVITFDALSSEAGILKTADEENGTKKVNTYEQLERINNINDLNKFLSYLTKSSDIIRSVTKSFLGNEKGGLNEQIRNYLEMRSKYKVSKEQENRKFGLSRATQKGHETKTTKTADNFKGLSLIGSVPLKMNTSFTPNLLKPLNQSITIDSDDELNEIWNNNDLSCNFELTDEDLMMDKLILRNDNEILNEPGQDANSHSAAPEVQVGNAKNNVDIKQNVPKPLKKDPKFNCGFCSIDGPCLCMETDSDLSRFKKT